MSIRNNGDNAAIIKKANKQWRVNIRDNKGVYING